MILGGSGMFRKKKPRDAKYKVLLVAYKDLDESVEAELGYYFISSIKNKNDIEENVIASDRSSSGLSFRNGIYHNWFKDKMLEKLKEGYKLGMVEIPISYGDSDVEILKELDDKFGDNILIVATEEL